MIYETIPNGEGISVSFQFSHFRNWLVLLVFLVIFPSMVVLIFYSAWEQRRTARRSAQETALRVAQLVAVEQERLIAATNQLLMTVAELHEVQEPNVAECNETFANLMKRFPYYTNIAAARPTGEVFCSGLPNRKPTNIIDRLYFQQAIRERRLAISHVLFGRMSGKPNVSVAYPAIDAHGVVRAVVFVGLDLGWLNSLAAQVQMPPGSILLAIDQKGSVFGRYPEPERWLGKSVDNELIRTIVARKEGFTETKGIDGVQRLYGFTTLHRMTDDTALYVSVGIPRELAFANSNQVFYRSFLVLIFVSLLAAVGTWVGAHLLVRHRLEGVIHTARAFGEPGFERPATITPAESKCHVGQYGELVEEMWSSLQKVTSRQADFSAMIAHDLRNAIHTGGFAASLLLDHSGPLTDKQRILAKSIQDNCNDLADIINDFMDFSKFKAGYLNLDKRDLDTATLLSDITSKYSSLAEQRKLRLSTDVGSNVGPVFADPRKIEQLIGNLLMNALKFTPEGGEITLSAQPSDGGVEVLVRDTGVGISDEELSLLFSKYQQTESGRKSRQAGTGLGLLICKMITAGHGGEIWVESEVNKGTVFHIWLPHKGEAVLPHRYGIELAGA